MVRKQLRLDVGDLAAGVKEARQGRGEKVGPTGQKASDEYERLRENLRRSLEEGVKDFKGVDRQEARAEYVAESREVAKTLKPGRLPARTNVAGHPPGTTMPRGWKVSTTSAGQIRVINERGHVVKGGTVRSAYRGPSGRITAPGVIDEEAFEASAQEFADGWFKGSSSPRQVAEVLRVARGMV